VVGGISSIAAFLIGFVPPSQFDGGNAFSYGLLIGIGFLLIALVIPILCLVFRRPSWRQNQPDASAPASAPAS
jgi:hypothetical protein